MATIDAAVNALKWRDQVKCTLINYERTRSARTVGTASIATLGDGMKILQDAKAIRLAAGQLVEAVEEWIDSQEPPLREAHRSTFDGTGHPANET